MKDDGSLDHRGDQQGKLGKIVAFRIYFEASAKLTCDGLDIFGVRKGINIHLG